MEIYLLYDFGIRLLVLGNLVGNYHGHCDCIRGSL